MLLKIDDVMLTNVGMFLVAVAKTWQEVFLLAQANPGCPTIVVGFGKAALALCHMRPSAAGGRIEIIWSHAATRDTTSLTRRASCFNAVATDAKPNMPFLPFAPATTTEPRSECTCG